MVAPSSSAPLPRGDVVVSVGGRPVLTAPLATGAVPLLARAPLAAGDLNALGTRVRTGYSGDSNYEASDGVGITVPTSREGITIVPRPRDSEAPAVEILSSADGVQHERGEPVVAIYSCGDVDDRCRSRRARARSPPAPRSTPRSPAPARSGCAPPAASATARPRR